MSEFKKAIQQASKDASELPSFPQKGTQYDIDVKKTRFEPIEDEYMEEQFGKKRTRKQTLYKVITAQGILRISPNQVQQLCKEIDKAEITTKTQTVSVLTSEGTDALTFHLLSVDNVPVSA